ncbi:MAG: hypothetical protein COV47_03625 [Candidatus Diapherotrites archaeon CG11_big_fil_rev_8_21_14_0_20_37_9]|nr:MAG: hypothetical protein COV47_03625 [Candidatus Diapherotrites archaeon CG11_big_fil_rev_8_21_14_0_20_37_9]
MVEFPEQGEVVIGKIVKVMDYGAIMDLIEYEGLQGFIHISEVSSSWVKNIRNFVKEGQIRAGKVTGVNSEKNHVDVSLTKVSANLQRSKIEEYKQSKRAQKMIDLLAEELKEDPDAVWEQVADHLIEKYDSVYEGFKAIIIHGESAAEGVPKKWLSALVDLVNKNYELPVKIVRGRLTISIPGSSGVDSIKTVLIAAEKKSGKDVGIFYEGSGNYSVKVSSTDYKSAEKLLKSFSESIVSEISSNGGKASYVKVEN